MLRIEIAIVSLLMLPAAGYASSENLDELVARKSRFATATWDKSFLENPTTLIWQPETLMYTDIETGHEVWRLSTTKELKNSLPDISWSHWSADGKRFSFGSTRSTSVCSGGYATMDNSSYAGSVMMMRADGSYLRPAKDAPFTVYVHSRYMHWSPTEPNVYYGFGRNFCGEGLQSDELYKVTVGDTSISKQMVLDMQLGGAEVNLKKAISSDGKKLVADTDGKFFPITIGPTISLDDPDGWAQKRQLDPYWGNTYPDETWDGGYLHDQFLLGTGAETKLYFIQEGKSSWWRYALSGAGADGGPVHTQSHTAPYSWGGIEPVATGFNSGGTCDNPLYRSPWNCDNDSATGPEQYFSHPGFDRWGRLVSAINSQYAQGWGVWDMQTKSWINRNIPAPGYDFHGDWEAWSDYFSMSSINSAYDNVYAVKKDGSDVISVASQHIKEAGSTDYNSYPRATQSPDGTKIVFHSDFLYSTANRWDLFYAVAYYPHPPEITSVTNNSGTYTIRFDWRLATTPRGYTTRGWPNEATNDPPPPRETKMFRLWRSANGSSGWEPVGTVNADIFSRYDFSSGDWSGTKYWEISDTPGAGTWYYAVTSQEWSGLESRTLSNVFSTAGSQTAAYPEDPKADADFTTSYQSAAKRYYNIYAADGATPPISQATRIASIPVTADKEYVDWLGDAGGTTKYVVTSVDSQGNESGVMPGVSYEHTATPGQYSITWKDAARYRYGSSLVHHEETP